VVAMWLPAGVVDEVFVLFISKYTLSLDSEAKKDKDIETK